MRPSTRHTSAQQTAVNQHFGFIVNRSAGHWCVWCSASFSRLACTIRRRFRAQANGWIDAENPRLARPLRRLSKARNSIRLVLGRSHLWSSRIRGVREILAHPGRKPMGHRKRSEIGGCQSKTAAQNNNEPPCRRKFLTQPTEFEKSGVLQHPLARWELVRFTFSL